VRQGGQRLGAFRPGDIIGTALALTGSPSAVEATFTEPARYMRWPLQSLREFMDKRPELRVALQGLVNRDLAGKLERVVAR
jgi:CRP-like cAMP-binding protein